MMINIPANLKQVFVDGVSVVLNSQEAQQLKKKYPQAKIKSLRKAQPIPDYMKPSACVDVTAQYKASM